MSRYRERMLEDALELNVRTVPVQDDESYQIAGVYSFGRGILRRSTILGSQTKYSTLYETRTGDFVLSRLKAFEGAVAVVPAELDGYYVSQEFPTFTVNTRECLPSYLAYLCEWPSFWERLSAGSKGIGSRRERVSAQKLLTTRVPLPDVDEQRRIVTKLEPALTVLPAVARRGKKLRAALTSSVFRSVFSRNFPARLAGEILRPAREAVDIDPLGEYRYIGVRSFGKGIIQYQATAGSELSKLRYFTFPEGAVVLSNIKAWEGAVAVTSRGEYRFIASNRFLFYVPRRDDEVDTRFVAYYLLSSAGLSELGRASPGSADRNRTLSIASFERITVPLPPLGVQRDTADRLDRIRVDLEQLARRRERLQTALRSALLNAAFSGQL